MLRKNYGCVRVDFNQPFSLKVNEFKAIFYFLIATSLLDYISVSVWNDYFV